MSDPLARAGVRLPIVQAPMAGVSTPVLAAAVSNAGALGSIAVGAGTADVAARDIRILGEITAAPFNVNLFVHALARADPEREAGWLQALGPLFAAYGAEAPPRLSEIYRSFADDEAMLRVLLELRPAVVSFHFGLPDERRTRALKQAGCVLLATVTSLAEAEAAAAAGMDALVAQGIEAGGHRGVFDPSGPDPALGTLALTRLLAVRAGLPVIAAGGLMDGQGVAAALRLGAVAAQLGTAFIACPESAADAAYRAALFGPAASETRMTRAISGRPARGLRNRFTDWGESEGAGLIPPDYPIAYDAGKALNAAARARGEPGFAAWWAGQGAPLARALPAAELIAQLQAEMKAAG